MRFNGCQDRAGCPGCLRYLVTNRYIITFHTIPLGISFEYLVAALYIEPVTLIATLHSPSASNIWIPSHRKPPRAEMQSSVAAHPWRQGCGSWPLLQLRQVGLGEFARFPPNEARLCHGLAPWQQYTRSMHDVRQTHVSGTETLANNHDTPS